jgi:sialic acid synthase SpsE
MKELVRGLREVEAGMGTTVRRFGERELGQRKVHRRSVIVNAPVKAGEMFTRENLVIKRPGTGIEPKHIDNILGKKASRDLGPETILGWSDVTF